MNNIDEYATVLKNYGSMEKVKDLYDQLNINYEQIHELIERIDKADNSDPEYLEHLYKTEFMLLMDNVGLYEDLKINIDQVERNQDNEFELARIKRDAEKMIIVEVIELG
jgi:hypothetical protein